MLDWDLIVMKLCQCDVMYVNISGHSGLESCRNHVHLFGMMLHSAAPLLR